MNLDQVEVPEVPNKYECTSTYMAGNIVCVHMQVNAVIISFKCIGINQIVNVQIDVRMHMLA